MLKPEGEAAAGGAAFEPAADAAPGEARRVLRLALSKPLPGEAAWAAMRPPYRQPAELSRGIASEDSGRGWREAAVLVLLHPTPAGLAFPLIERTHGLRHHAGQIALPGGALESGETPLEAALRETREEIGIAVPRADVVGALSDIRALPSGYVVHPFVALSGDIGELTLQPGEAAASFEATLADLLAERSVSTFTRHMEDVDREDRERPARDLQGRDWQVPCYRFGGNIVWGLTAMILAELAAAIRPPLLPERAACEIMH